MTSSAKVRALFLDRDGVINHEVGYLHRTEDVRWIEGIVSLCRTAMELGYKLVVVTNQSGIARGYYTMQQYDELTAWMRAEMLQHNVIFDAIYCCPYHPEGLGEYQREHDDRKPSPGMLLRGERELGVDLSRSLLVGDRCSDIAAANAAGLLQAFLITGTEPEPCLGRHVVVDSLIGVERWIRDHG